MRRRLLQLLGVAACVLLVVLLPGSPAPPGAGTPAAPVATTPVGSATPIAAPRPVEPHETLVRVRPEQLLGGGPILVGEPVVLDVQLGGATGPGQLSVQQAGVELARAEWSAVEAAVGSIRRTLVVPAGSAPVELVRSDAPDPVLVEAAPVISARPRVLVVDGPPRREWRHIHRALRRDGGLDARATLLEADEGWVDFADAQVRGGDLPDFAALRELDVLFLGDVGVVTPDWTSLIRAWVEAGGGLVLFGVKQAWLLSAELADLAPVLLPESGPPDRLASVHAWGFGPTALGGVALPLHPEPAESARRWAALPGPWRFDRVGAFPPGQVLVTAGAQDATSPLVVVGPAGRGTVVWLGLDETWRWGESGAYLHRRLARVAARRALHLAPRARAEALDETLTRAGLPGARAADVSTAPLLARRLGQLRDLAGRYESHLAARVRADHGGPGEAGPRSLLALARGLEALIQELTRLARPELYRHAAEADRAVVEAARRGLDLLDVSPHLEEARRALLEGRALASFGALHDARAGLGDVAALAGQVAGAVAPEAPVDKVPVFPARPVSTPEALARGVRLVIDFGARRSELEAPRAGHAPRCDARRREALEVLVRAACDLARDLAVSPEKPGPGELARRERARRWALGAAGAAGLSAALSERDLGAAAGALLERAAADWLDVE